MSVNFFNWIRDGVRQSVLLGVSDAVERLGTPVPADQLHPTVLAFLQDGNAAASPAANGSEAPRILNSASPVPRSKKRLGRSLKEIQGDATKPQ